MSQETTQLRQIKQMLIGIEITIVGIGIAFVGIGYVSTALFGVGLLVTLCGVGYTAFRTVL